jgi:hypothetical protein
MADWVTVFSSLATAGGTLVLAAATFSSIKSANRSARLAERALLAGQRPILIPSREDDPAQRVRFGDGVILTVEGHGGKVEVVDGRVYMAIALRNGGAGVAVLHGWRAEPLERTVDATIPPLDALRRQLRDLYIPAGETGFWQGAVRDPDDGSIAGLRSAAEAGSRVMVDLLYGDHEGGQRTVARFGISAEDSDRADVLRYWNVDGDDPR